MGIKGPNQIRRGRNELLLQLADAGIPIGEENKQTLRSNGFGKLLDADELLGIRGSTDGRQHLWLTQEQAQQAKNRKENPQENAESYLGRIPKEWVTAAEGKEITKSDWAPERIDLHSDEFRSFVQSSIPRFDLIKPFKPFYLYVKQSRDWIAENSSVEDHEGQDQWEYVNQEFDRIAENKLYAMDKYGWIRDDQMPGGWRKYFASTPQALLSYSYDCGYSNEIGKGRQAAITSTEMLLMVFSMLTKTSMKGVLVTDDIEFTGKSIFEDKLKSSYIYIVTKNPWLKPPKVPNYSAKKITFDWSEATTKSEQRALSADFTLAASDDTQTINGTTPSVLIFDETQNIPTYASVKLEARPTMLSNVNGIIRVARQLIAYGTGSSHQRGKGAFENEYKNTLAKWNRGDSTSSFVPLFLDWTCRPGMTQSLYEQEYDFYLNTSEDESLKGLSKEERKAMFHAAYPSSPEDMFLTSHKTIVPAMFIRSQQERILEAQREYKDEFMALGRFEPIYDYGSPMPAGSYLPFVVKGAKFIKARPDDFEAPIKMFMEPQKNWVRRYFQGTDPIQSASGSSNFASLIKDAVGVSQTITENGTEQTSFNPTIACALNFRPAVMEEAFLQSKLMGMYYANVGQRACMEVFEYNQGQAYEQFVMTQMNLKESLWRRIMLPKKYTGGSQDRGVDMKGGYKDSRKQNLYFDTNRWLREEGHNIWYYDFWTQVSNIDVEDRGDFVEWGTKNRNLYTDDMLFAGTYADMSSRCEREDPKEIRADAPEYRYKQVLKRRADLMPYYETTREKITY